MKISEQKLETIKAAAEEESVILHRVNHSRAMLSCWPNNNTAMLMALPAMTKSALPVIDSQNDTKVTFSRLHRFAWFDR